MQKTIIAITAASLFLTSCAIPNGPESIILVGDTYFGESYQETRPINILQQRGYNHSIDNFTEILWSAKSVVVNLETALTYQQESPFEDDKSYIHRSEPMQNFAVFQNNNLQNFSLANNHAADFGAQALPESINLLREKGFNTFGAGANKEQAQEPLYISVSDGEEDLTVALIGAFEYRPTYDAKYSFYVDENKPGVSRLDLPTITTQINKIKTREPQAFIIVFPHWGDNYKSATPAQKMLGKEILDAGANLIIGHGAHTIQEIQQHGSKWIAYSIGNFVFNSPGRYDNEGAPPYGFIARLAFTEEGKTLQLYPIFTNNKITDYQSRFVTDEEFAQIATLYNQQGISSGEDRFGNYLEIHL